MANRLVKVRQVSNATNTSECGTAFAQISVLPINGLTDGVGVCIDRSENIDVSDVARHVIFKYRRGSTASQVFAGTIDVAGYADGVGTAAKFNQPKSMCVDRRGTLWVVDSGNKVIRRVTENGVVYTVAQIPAEVLGDTPGQIAVDDGENIFLIDNTP